jgi:hypothetical protein
MDGYRMKLNFFQKFDADIKVRLHYYPSRSFFFSRLNIQMDVKGTN